MRLPRPTQCRLVRTPDGRANYELRDANAGGLLARGESVNLNGARVALAPPADTGDRAPELSIAEVITVTHVGGDKASDTLSVMTAHD